MAIYNKLNWILAQRYWKCITAREYHLGQVAAAHTFDRSQATCIPEFFIFPGQTSVFENDHISHLEAVPCPVQMQLMEFLSLEIYIWEDTAVLAILAHHISASIYLTTRGGLWRQGMRDSVLDGWDGYGRCLISSRNLLFIDRSFVKMALKFA